VNEQNPDSCTYGSTISSVMQILAGLLSPTGGTVYVKGPKSFVFQNPDHQVCSLFFSNFCIAYVLR
jgi:energy-coupling factor transporter ATP-binding protein EcfA2